MNPNLQSLGEEHNPPPIAHLRISAASTAHNAAAELTNQTSGGAQIDQCIDGVLGGEQERAVRTAWDLQNRLNGEGQSPGPPKSWNSWEPGLEFQMKPLHKQMLYLPPLLNRNLKRYFGILEK